MKLVGIEPPQCIENIELVDSTMFLIGTKGSNAQSAVQNGTENLLEGQRSGVR